MLLVPAVNTGQGIRRLEVRRVPDLDRDIGHAERLPSN